MSLLDLKSDIKKGNIKKVYLFYGQEDYLKKMYFKDLEDAVLGQSEKLLNLFVFEGKTDEEMIVDACETMPVFSEKKMVIVRNSNFFKTKKNQSAEKNSKKSKGKRSKFSFEDYLLDLPDYLCLVFIEDEADKRLKLFDAVKKTGLVVEFEFQKPKDLTKWVISSFKGVGKEIDAIVASFIVECCDLGMQDIKNEIDKICSYALGQNIITIEDVEKIISKTTKTRIFGLTDEIGKKNVKEALIILDEIIELREPIQKIIYFITRHFANILKYKELEQEGVRSNDISSKLGITPYVALKLPNQSKNFSKKVLRLAYEDCLEMDLAIKTGKISDRIAIELFITQYSSKEQNAIKIEN